MGLKEAFAPEEWARIVGAPMLAGIAVTAADPGGVWGAVTAIPASIGAPTIRAHSSGAKASFRPIVSLPQAGGPSRPPEI